MAIDTKPNLSNSKFEQCVGDLLVLSGITDVHGTFELSSGATLSILNNRGAGKVLTSNSGGTATWQVIQAALITGATNGLGVTNKKVCLGGTLLNNTNINLNNYNLVFSGGTGNTSITGGLELLTTPANGLTSDSIIVWNSSDYLIKKISTSSLTGTSIITANNGLNKAGTNIRLGGALTGNTTICGAYTLNISGGTKLNTQCGLQISGQTMFDASRNSLSNIIIGQTTLNNNTTGTNNLAVGCLALNKNTCGCNNVAIGYQASYCNTGGTNNVAIGYQALSASTMSCNNTAIGFQALAKLKCIGGDNVGIGYQALNNTTLGCMNVAIGNGTIYNNVAGYWNVAIGHQALYCGENSANVAIGYSALRNSKGSNCNIAIGQYSMNNSTGAGGNNAAMGTCAMFSNTSGANNIAIGCWGLYANTTGSNNSAQGFRTLRYNTVGGNNIANGNNVLYNNTSGSSNIAMGYQALSANTIGCNNIAMGCLSLVSNTCGCYNTAIGYQALMTNISGNSNIANGYQALNKNTKGCYNIAMGYQALSANTTGCNNIANGICALSLNTTGCYNTAIGYSALTLNTTGCQNIAIGMYALYNTKPTSAAITAFSDYSGTVVGTVRATSTHGLPTGTTDIVIYGTTNFNGSYTVTYINTTSFYFTKAWVSLAGENGWWGKSEGNDNVGIGSCALFKNTCGFYNIAIGNCSLICNTTGRNNIANGSQSLRSNTTGCNNIGLGCNAGYSNQTGTGNTFIGLCAGYSETTSNKLYIANSSTNRPLIYGEFPNTCAIIYGAFKTSGATSLLVAPVAGTCSDNVLVWNSSDKLIKKVPYISGGTSSALTEFTITGNSTATGFTVNHAKNKQFVAVEVVKNTSPYPTIYTNVERTNANCICVTFDIAPANGQQYKILIIN